MAGTVNYNGVPISVDTPLGRELMKWERKPNYRPENHQYPQMVYLARKCADGVVRAEMPEPNQFHYTKEQMGVLQRDTDSARAFNLSCQKTVQNEDEHRLAHGQGWRTSMAEAVEAAKEGEYSLQEAAAARLIDDRNMSDNAKEEVRQAEAATPEVLPMIPIAPTVKKIDGRSKEARAARSSPAV